MGPTGDFLRVFRNRSSKTYNVRIAELNKVRVETTPDVDPYLREIYTKVTLKPSTN